MNIGGVLMLAFIGSLAQSAAAQAAFAVGYSQLFFLVTWTSVGLMGTAAAVAGQNLGATQSERADKAVDIVVRFGSFLRDSGGIFLSALSPSLSFLLLAKNQRRETF
jgi:Na+-driven multidrug efflux pump